MPHPSWSSYALLTPRVVPSTLRSDFFGPAALSQRIDPATSCGASPSLPMDLELLRNGYASFGGFFFGGFFFGGFLCISLARASLRGSVNNLCGFGRLFTARGSHRPERFPTFCFPNIRNIPFATRT